ncbi:MAG: DUF6036 family nucleotidyltransferase [Planctomycetota bacterium]|jgi:hypothetical protein
MTRGELEHAIRAACDVAGDSEIYVFGSQAILGEHPSAPEELRQSVEVDVAPKNSPERVDEIDGALGELSQFHQTHGFYVHGVSLETAVLPPGWKGRVIRVQNQNTNQYSGWCVEAHDLAASKLVAFREKDREFVRVLLTEHLIDTGTLIARIRALPRPADERERLIVWVEITNQDLR